MTRPKLSDHRAAGLDAVSRKFPRHCEEGQSPDAAISCRTEAQYIDYSVFTANVFCVIVGFFF